MPTPSVTPPTPPPAPVAVVAERKPEPEAKPEAPLKMPPRSPEERIIVISSYTKAETIKLPMPLPNIAMKDRRQYDTRSPTELIQFTNILVIPLRSKSAQQWLTRNHRDLAGYTLIAITPDKTESWMDALAVKYRLTKKEWVGMCKDYDFRAHDGIEYAIMDVSFTVPAPPSALQRFLSFFKRRDVQNFGIAMAKGAVAVKTIL